MFTAKFQTFGHYHWLLREVSYICREKFLIKFCKPSRSLFYSQPRFDEAAKLFHKFEEGGSLDYNSFPLFVVPYWNCFFFKTKICERHFWQSFLENHTQTESKRKSKHAIIEVSIVPKQWNGGHVSVPNQSPGSWTLFLSKRFLLLAMWVETLYRWWTVNKRSLISSFCLSTSICSFHQCYLCLPRLHENHP